MENYKNNNYICFNVDISQKINKNGIYKKSIKYPKNWDDGKIHTNKNWNSIALLTGYINKIFVIDIDNVNHWEQLLKSNNKLEPITVKAQSGSGGIHLYFKYTDNLKDIKNKSHCFGSNYDIDVRTNGGNIIVPPSTYFDNNTNAQVKYIWIYSIFEYKMIAVPKWMLKLLYCNIIKKS